MSQINKLGSPSPARASRRLWSYLLAHLATGVTPAPQVLIQTQGVLPQEPAVWKHTHLRPGRPRP